MSQTFTDNCYDSTHQVSTDMASIENNFAALKSMFSGAAAPADIVAGMLWFDTTKNLPKMRNEANDDWLGVMQADTSHKLWVYRNTAPDGWVVDSSVTDVVLALKGGTQAYNANGGTTGGTWTQPDGTLSVANLPSHYHTHSHIVPVMDISAGGSSMEISRIMYNYANQVVLRDVTLGSDSTATGSGTAHNHGSTYRPAAAIGTLQYLNI